jgi:methionyl-tRNA formyltransferase
MLHTDLRIVFMGTPEFAVASLDALVQAGCNIVGVITAPDKPAGRGMKLTQSAVKKYAVDKGLHVLQPGKLKNPEFIEELKSLQADVQVVVAFRMLPEVVWSMPPFGTINVHGSLLPQYRGAAPINWAIINGEQETGVTTFRLQHAIDTGNILLQEKIPISVNETAGELHDVMKEVGAQLLVKTIKGIAAGNIQEQPQTLVEDSALKHAPKLFTDTCTINWNQTCDSIHNLVRGLSPFPGALTKLNDKILKIYSCTKENTTPVDTPGSWSTDNKTYLKFACADGYVHLLDMQLEGKKRMMIQDFLRGFRVVG